MYATLILPGMYVLSWVFAFITFLDHFMSFYIAKGWSGYVQHLTRLQKVLSQFQYLRQAYSQVKIRTNVWANSFHEQRQPINDHAPASPKDRMFTFR